MLSYSKQLVQNCKYFFYTRLFYMSLLKIIDYNVENCGINIYLDIISLVSYSDDK